jgi:23S rRNA (cytidine1920-2'-O)/16S rRNA (cytidine1409-2'-O)-methyltransferase
MERTNARHLESLPEPIDLVTIDVSFISLLYILPQVQRWLAEGGSVIALIKPQFEAGREQVGKGGVVRDPAVHRRVLESVLARAATEGWVARGLVVSPIKGPKGNTEFLMCLTRQALAAPDVDRLIEGAMSEAMGMYAAEPRGGGSR